jgi:type IV pilus secretin PilQ/predicted competence protein
MRAFRGAVFLLVLGTAYASMQAADVPGGGAPEGPSASSPAPPADSSSLDVRGVRVEPAGAGCRVTIALTQEPGSVTEAMLGQGRQLVIDLGGGQLTEPRPVRSFPFSDDPVSRVQVGSRHGKLRAVIDFTRKPGPYAVRREGTDLIVDVGDASRATAGVSAADPSATGAPSASQADDPRRAEGPSQAAAAPESRGLAVQDVKIEPVGTGRRLTVLLNRAPDGLRDFVLGAPPRLVIDLKGSPPEKPPGLVRFPLADDLVSAVRVAWKDKALRVVLDLHKQAGAHTVRNDGALLVAELGDTGSADAGEPWLMLASALVTEALGDDAPTDAAFDAAEAAPSVAPAAAAGGESDPAEPPANVAPARAEAPPPPPAAEPPPAPAPVPPTPRRAPSARQAANVTPYGGERISLDFKDADIQNVLRVLADVSHLNIIATDDVKGKVTLHLTDVPWSQALDLVLRSNRLEKTQEGNVMRISTVARLKEEREALRAAQDAALELEPLRVKYVRVNYARADEALVDKVKGVLTDRGSVTFDDRTNTIIVRDIPRGLEDASALVRELDVQSPQVLIEANLVEANEDFARALGVQWGYNFKAGPQTGNPTGMNFPGTVGLGGSGLGAGTPPPGTGAGAPPSPVPFLADFPVPSGFGSGFGPGAGSALDLALGSISGAHSLSARLTALEDQGKGKVISRPRVITMNNVAATIQSLTILRVKLPSTGTVINTGTGGAAGSASTATEKINTGITLVVTPQISSDGYVLMNIFAKSSQPDFTHSVDNIPNEVSREANSNVLIHDGETVVLGGIFRNISDTRESGLPYLRKVPVLGWLFKRLLRTDHREELLVFLTPKIVASGTAALPPASQLWEERQQGG